MPEAGLERAAEPLVIGRYAMFGEIASGGMATVHLGCVLGGPDHGHTVAIKRLHPKYLKDHDFLVMFHDEARIVARIRHPNVVSTSEVVEADEGIFLVMEYVHGETLSKLLRAARAKHESIPPPIAARILYDVLLGLHGAHETRSETGEMLDVVHRDVSPQNVMVATDGISRVLDFGVAKAAGRAQITREGQIKGKITYMAPEQVRGQVDRRTDVFAAAVVLWEAIAGRRLHEGLKDYEIVSRVVQGKLPKPSAFAPAVPPALDEIVMRGLTADPAKRWSTAETLARELAAKVELASAEEVAAWVERLAHDALDARAKKVEEIQLAAAAIEPPPASASNPVLASTEDAPVRGAPFGIVLTPTLHGGFPPPGAPATSEAAPSDAKKPDSAFELDSPFAEPAPPSPRVARDSSRSLPDVFSAAPPPPNPRSGALRDPELRPYVIALVVSALLAVVGAALGTYALFGPKRDPRRPAPAMTAPHDPAR